MITAFDRPGASAAGDSASEGTSGAAARADHVHGREAATVTFGSGVPTGGADGNYYFRTDTPATVNQRLYVRSAGVWTGIL